MAITITTGGPVSPDANAPLFDYDSLKAAVADWMARGDVSGNAANFIILGEAALNRELPANEQDITLTGTVDSRQLDVSGLQIVDPIALFRVDSTTGDETAMTMKTDGSFPYRSSSGTPRFWALDSGYIDMDCPLDAAYTFRFRYAARLALSDNTPSNWLLEEHPDVYLAAVLIWGGIYTQDDPAASRWASILSTTIPRVRNTIVQSKRALLSVDNGLLYRRTYNGGWE